jgi:translation initiation factor 1
MTDAGAPKRSRVVYTTDRGRRCPVCGWPQEDCRCSKNLATSRGETVPAKPVAKLRVENRASGKQVTIVAGLPRNEEWLAALCRELKKACGAGGSAGEDSVEIQGDHRERLRELLARKGMAVKG